MLFADKHAPNPAFVLLLDARVAYETDGPHQFSIGKGAQNVVVDARGGQALAKDFHRCGAMLLGGLAKGPRFQFESFQAQVPEGIGILRSEGANLYIHSWARRAQLPSSCPRLS